MHCRFRLQEFIHGDAQGGSKDRVYVLGHYSEVDEPLKKAVELAAQIPDRGRTWVHYEVVMVISVED